MKKFLFALALMLTFMSAAQARLHGGVASGGGVLFTSLQLPNSTGSTIAANSISDMRQHWFVKGQIANGCSGSAPIFKIHSDSTVVPFSESTQPICWNDGSLKGAAFIWRDPESIAAATAYTVQSSGNSYSTSNGQIVVTLNTTPTYSIGYLTLSSLTGTGGYAALNGTWKVISVASTVVTLQGPYAAGGLPSATINGGTATQPTYIQVDVYSGGTTPAASSRSLSDFTAGGLDLNQKVVGLDSQLSGTWESELSQGISANGADYKYMDGAAGAVWRVRAAFRQSGSNHGQLEGWWYIAALQDDSGNLAGIRYLVGTTAPYYNVSSPAANFWSFSSISDYNGASLLQDPWSGHESSYSFSWAGGGTSNLTTSSYPWETGNLLRLSGGSLPTGLSAATSYFMGGNFPYDGTNFFVGNNSSYVVNGNAITPTGSSCSPCGTAISYPYITQFGTMYDAQSNGRWNYIQGNGSVATDPDIQPILNMTYLRSTKLIPPYNFSGHTASNTAWPFFPMTFGPVSRNFGATGEDCNIGPFNCWQVQYLFNQTPLDEEAIRTIGLAAGEMPFNFRDSSSNNIPSMNTGSYTNMHAESPWNYVWQCETGSTFNGNNLPANTNVWIPGVSGCTTDHYPEMSMMAWMITGEPQFMDMEENWGEMAYLARNNSNLAAGVNGTSMSIGCDTAADCVNLTSAERNLTVGGTTYYEADLDGSNGIRDDAWAARSVAAAMLASAADPSCAGCSSYFNDIVSAQQNAFAAYTGLFTAAGYTYAYNNGAYAEGGVGPWTVGYLINTLNMTVNWTENSGVPATINYLNKWFAHVNSTFGTSWVGSYTASLRTDSATNYKPYASADTGIGFGGQLQANWAPGSPAFTSISGPTGYTLQNGDHVLFDSNTLPGGFSVGTCYKWTGVSGSSGDLELCSGGGVINPSDSGSAGGGFFIWGPSLVPPYAESPPDGADTYTSNLGAAFQYSNALGLTVDSTLLSNMNSLVQSQSSYPNGYLITPKYYFQNNFLAPLDDMDFMNDNWEPKLLLRAHP